jgi:tRNA-2-methylthio-N6-dimethylallyladenosine synthase
MALVRAAGYAHAFSFKYSPRPGTPAAESDQLPEEVKADRLGRLQALLAEQQRAFNEAMVGRRLPVLVEKPGRHAGQMAGRSPYLQAVHFPGAPEMAGRIVELRIEGAGQNSLAGAAA